MKMFKLLSVALLAVVAGTAHADATYYMGVSGGVSNYSVDGTSDISNKGAFNLRGGAEWAWVQDVKIGAELSYQTSKATAASAVDVTTKGVGVAGVIRYTAWDPVDVYAKIGVIREKWDVASAVSDYANRFTYALGASYAINKQFAITADYSQFYNDSSMTIGATQVGVEYRF